MDLSKRPRSVLLTRSVVFTKPRLVAT